MAQENYVEGCSMQRQLLLEADVFCFWKSRFETYVKSKDINLWKTAKVTVIEEAKDLVIHPLVKLIGNLKVYEIVIENDGVGSRTTREKIAPIALKAKVTRDQTSNNIICQDESYGHKKINLMAKNFRKLFR
nr:zf-CCHC domain-containing protein/UBN2 domain-containing protein [Tanacetum cinerariifolium]